MLRKGAGIHRRASRAAARAGKASRGLAKWYALLHVLSLQLLANLQRKDWLEGLEGKTHMRMLPVSISLHH